MLIEGVKQEDVDNLRKNLKDGRSTQNSSAASGTGENPLGNAGGVPRTDGTSVPTILSERGSPSASDGRPHDAKRGTGTLHGSLKPILKQRGQRSGRSSENKFVPEPVAETNRSNIRAAGRLITEEPIHERKQAEPAGQEAVKSENAGTADIQANIGPRKRGRPPKQRIADFAQNLKGNVSKPENKEQQYVEQDAKATRKDKWYKESATLSSEEARELEEPLIAALRDDLSYIDRYLWYKTGDVTKSPVWSDITIAEVKPIARMMLKRAKVSGQAASAVRAVVDGSDYLTTAMAILPRIVLTVDILKKAPKKERKRREVRN